MTTEGYDRFKPCSQKWVSLIHVRCSSSSGEEFDDDIMSRVACSSSERERATINLSYDMKGGLLVPDPGPDWKGYIAVGHLPEY